MNIKTAISVRENIYDEAERVARELQVSRSHLYSVALEEYLMRYRSRQLLEQINLAYSDEPDPEEARRSKMVSRLQKRLAEGEWK
jgi:metal-responsive CopG/Arc/MetJ family transcriptional regulator